MQDNEWWRPSNLKKEETKSRLQKNISELDETGDFGSYRKALLVDDIKKTKISSHNDIYPELKIKQLCKRLNNKNPKRILDVGCGLGFTASAIASYYNNTEVLGIDISYDAIQYAQKQFNNAEYKVFSVSPDAEDLGLFDYIFCFEFYPFTRNKDLEIQLSFIEYLLRQLSDNGEIILYQKWDNESSLSVVFEKIKLMLKKATVKKETMPNPKISLYFPDWIGKPIAFILSIILRKEILRTYVVIKKNN